MRLTQNYIDKIKQTAQQLMGENTLVWLFGSRIDDSLKGGDIDLLIETDKPILNRAEMNAKYTALLQQQLGDQRFDILLHDPSTPMQKIYSIAKKQGIRL